MRIRSASFLFGLAAALSITGCGGGAGGSSTPAPAETAFASGDLEGRAAISNPPVTSATPTCVATAFTGTFSSLKIRELNPGLNETRVAYVAEYDGSIDLYSSAPDGSDIVRITTTGHNFAPSYSPNGRLAYESNRTGTFEIYTSNWDGSSESQITTSGDHRTPSFDAAGDRIAAQTENPNGIEVIDVASKAITPLTIPGGTGAAYAPCISLDGKTVYFLWVTSAGAFLYKEAAVGETPTFMGEFDGAVGMALSQDGRELAILSPSLLTRVGTGDETTVSAPLPAGIFDGVSYSPDGKFLTICENQTGAPNYQVYTYNLATGFMSLITPPTAATYLPSWSPFAKDRTLIAGGGGLLGTRACGVIQAQRGAQTSSVVAFDVTTPSSVVMTAQTAQSGSFPDIVFSADADNITKLAFANGIDWRGIRAIGSGTPVTSANGALITINSSDGTVISVLPFTGTRAAGSKPTVRDDGSTKTFSGQFLAVYDKNGNNLAPSGASVVKLDMTTGKMAVGN